MIEITIPTDPVAAARPRVTKWGNYYPQKYREYLASCKGYVRRLGVEKIRGGIHADIEFIFKTPKSWSKKKQLAHHNKHYISKNKNDMDNLIKACLDFLQSYCYDDDSQIVSVNASKRWSSETGKTRVVLNEVREHE